MDCEAVQELLDAYAIGAAEPAEAAAIERHVADCVRCWSTLSETQRAAAGLAFSSALQRAPDSLRQRILAETASRAPSAGGLVGVLQRLAPVGAGLITAGAAAALAFAIFLQTQVNDLQQENDDLTARVQTAGAQISQQRNLMSILAAPDAEQITLVSTTPTAQSESATAATYRWSKSAGKGALFCNELPRLEEGQVYRLWFVTPTDAYEAGSFYSWEGVGQMSVDLDDVPSGVTRIGISIQDADDNRKPDSMLLLADLPR
jgi:hypothetical protein